MGPICVAIGQPKLEQSGEMEMLGGLTTILGSSLANTELRTFL